jgi:hypothetical protein
VDTPPEVPDVDFFSFEATPGAPAMAELKGAPTGAGTLADPFLGLFDSACNLVAFNDDFGSLNSRLTFVVPADGDFVLAASGCCDDDFTGVGDSSGSYALTVGPVPPPIGSIAGRVVDADSGEPLPGDAPPFALVELRRCEGDECLEFVNEQGTDGDGGYRFEQNFNGDPIGVGTYQVIAFSQDFEDRSSGPFDVSEGEDFDTGDILLERPPFFFSDIKPCGELELLPQGGTCHYFARLTNTTNGELNGFAWSVVEGFEFGSSLDFTLFEASTRPGSRVATRERVAVAPLGDQILHFQFAVPSFAEEGATFCTTVFLGVVPDPLVNTFVERSLFCITKGATEFELMAAAQSQKMLRALSGRTKSRAVPAPKAK